MSNENEENNLESQLSRAQVELRTIREKYPDVWDEILKSNICPCNFGLHNSCGLEAESCKKCWETALKIVLDENVTITKAGFYLCKQCNKPLVFDKVTAGAEQYWHCPQCLNFYKIKLNGDISLIEKTNKEEADKAQSNPDTFDMSELMSENQDDTDDDAGFGESGEDIPY